MPTPLVTRRLPLLLGFLIAVGPLSTDMYLPAFPAIARDFHNLAAPQDSLAAYFLGLAFGQITQGALSDRFGRRLPVFAGLALYTLACFGCALCWNTGSLVFFRFLTALGCSAGIVIPRAMVRDLADGHEAARLLSRLMLAMGVAPVVAPTLGAATLGLAGWRAIFLVTALYGVLALASIWYLLPDTLPAQRRTRIGPLAILIRYGAILRERAFITHALTAAFTFGALFAYLAATPQIFIGHYHWTTAQYALLFGVNSIAYIGFNQLNPMLVRRFGIPRVISLAVAALSAACAVLALLALVPQGPFALAAALLATELGFGLITPCAIVGALSRHQAHAGSASALHGTLQYGFGAIASLAIGAFGNGTAGPMALAMLLCALGAALAASLRPPLIFTLPES